MQKYLEFAQSLSAASNACVLATLVNATGSSFRRPGAQMLVHSNRIVLGGISAGCIEEEIREKCFDWTRAGACVKEFHVGSDGDDIFGWASGCKGCLSVLLQRIEPGSMLFAEITNSMLSRETRVAATVWSNNPWPALALGTHLITAEGSVGSDVIPYLENSIDSERDQVLDSGASRNVRYATAEGDFSVLWEIVEPAVRLCIFGSGDGVRSLVDFSRKLGWYTVVCDKRSELYNQMMGIGADRIYECTPGEHPDGLFFDQRSAAVVMTHNFADDLSIISSLLRTRIPYIGVLGGHTRNSRLKEELLQDHSSRQIKRLFAPIGLDLGAEGDAEIALSITAEILACLKERRPRHLKDRKSSIHKPFPTHYRTLEKLKTTSVR